MGGSQKVPVTSPTNKSYAVRKVCKSGLFANLKWKLIQAFHLIKPSILQVPVGVVYAGCAIRWTLHKTGKMKTEKAPLYELLSSPLFLAAARFSFGRAFFSFQRVLLQCKDSLFSWRSKGVRAPELQGKMYAEFEEALTSGGAACVMSLEQRRLQPLPLRLSYVVILAAQTAHLSGSNATVRLHTPPGLYTTAKKRCAKGQYAAFWHDSYRMVTRGVDAAW